MTGKCDMKRALGVLILLALWCGSLLTGAGTAAAASYCVTATSGANGTVTPAGTTCVTGNNKNIAYTITPSAGYQVANVVVDGVSKGSTTSWTFANLNTNHTISATFSVFYTVTANNGSGGTISPSGTQNVQAGATPSYTVTADSTHYVTGLTLSTGATLAAAAKSTSATFTLPAVNANVTVTPTYSVRPSYTISTQVWSYKNFGYVVGDTTGGTATPASSTVYEGNSVTLTMTPAAGYALRGIFVDDSTGADFGASSPFTLSNVTANHTVYVRFRPTEHTITASVTGPGTISPAGSIATSQFGDYTFTITPNAGANIQSVVVDGVNRGALSSYTFSGPTVNHTIVANFVLQTCTYTASVDATNNFGTISPGTTTVNYGQSQTFTMTPTSSAYEIQKVVVDGVSQGAVSTWQFDCSAINHSIVAYFVAKTQYTITTSPGANGTIAPAGPTTLFAGSSQSYTITPNAGYAIVDVQAGPTGGAMVSVYPQLVNNSYTFSSLSNNMTLSATFARSYTISASAGANGAITPAGDSVPVVSGNDKTFYMVPNSGYVVDTVTVDGVSQGSISSYTFRNVAANGYTISVTFRLGGAAMSQYCDIPSFIAAAPKPNVLLMLDNSSSMYDLAYNDPGTFCFDSTYDDSGPYSGYFNPSAFYAYDGATSKFYSAGVTMPAAASCDYGGGTGYVCVKMNAGSVGARTVQNFVASGKFLNWLASSKLDVEKAVLTGGKYDVNRQLLIGESRGCLGRRFAKQIKKADGSLEPITFAIRGPGAADTDNVNPTSQGGLTRIEIYEASYQEHQSDCEAAMADWMNGVDSSVNLGRCAGLYSTDITGAGQQNQLYKSVVSACSNLRNGIAPDPHQFETHCSNLYKQNGDSFSSITNPYGFAGICGDKFSHDFMNNDGHPNNTGYLGKCMSGSPPHETWDPVCEATEIRDYCRMAWTGSLTDPSFNVIATDSAANSGVNPGVFVDAAVLAMGPAAATYFVNVASDTAPSLLINDFKNLLNFGLMTFNYDGTKSETTMAQPMWCNANHDIACFVNANCPSGDTCVAATATDGGVVRVPIITNAEVGDHSSGLVKAIDDIKAASWTPWGEAFYNAIGYYAPFKTCNGLTNGTRCYNDRDCSPGQCMLTGKSVGTETTTGGKFTGQTGAGYSYDENANPVTQRCQNNYVMILSDGMSTADRNSQVSTLASLGVASYGAPSYSGTFPYNGSATLPTLSWLAKNRNLANFSKPLNFTDFSNSSTNPVSLSSEFLTTYVVYTGIPCDAATGTLCSSGSDVSDPEYFMQMTAKNGGAADLSTYFRSDNPALLESNLRQAFGRIASQTSSGTAASILSNSEGSGANILQAVFYPKKSFDNGATNLNWIGELQNLWYYVDPFIGKSSVREDTGYTTANREHGDPHYFNLKTDLQARFFFDPGLKQTQVQLARDTDGDGLGDLDVGTPESADQVNSLWRAGKQLWQRTTARTIYTAPASGTALADFTALNTGDAGVRNQLQATDAAEATRIINYIKGVDDPAYRSRSLVIPSVDSTARIWKLGDIITSTPRVQSTQKQNSFNTSPPTGYSDLSYGPAESCGSAGKGFVCSESYRNRGMAYVGANDGMLHAFKMGKLDVAASGDQKATLSGNNLGEEQWSFVPQNTFPYLKYLADKNYSHLYYVDGNTVLLDASIGGCGVGNYWDCGKDFPSGSPGDAGYSAGGSNWRSVLISSMGLGGATRDKSGTCNGGTSDCVKSPIDNGGYSSYFALDITNQSFDSDGNLVEAPKFMWEFSHPELGYSTSGPALVKINAKNAVTHLSDTNKNGRWFAVFASGPTGPIDPGACQFKGKSDQNLKLFIVDLAATPPFSLGTNYWVLDTGIANSFAGTISAGVVDTDRWNPADKVGYYQDDVVYVGYVSRGDGTWNDGGVLRLVINENYDPSNAPSSATWVTSKVIDGVGPVTTSIAKLQDVKKHNLWLYFGTGRYMFNQDDLHSARRIYGIKDPCYKASATHVSGAATKDDIQDGCTDTITQIPFVDPVDQTSNPSATLADSKSGWFIDLIPADAAESAADTAAGLGAERVITDPVSLINGTVLFTTFKPATDPCMFGGNSYLWGVKYNTGAAASANALTAKVLVQVSTGSFQEVDLASALTKNYNRKMGSPMTGKPPSDPPPVISKSNLRPVKRILQIREK